MTDKLSLLAKTAKRIRVEAGYTLDQVEANSGGTITGGYASKIENGQAGDVTVTKLLALAKGLRVLPQVLFDAASGEKPKDTIHVSRAVAILRELGEADQRLGVRLLDALRSAKDDSEGGNGRSVKGDSPTLPMPSKNISRKRGAKKQGLA